MKGDAEEKLQQLKQAVVAWYLRCNQQGIWLFIVTLGCWSVPIFELRLAAYILTLAFFFYELTSVKEWRTNFKHELHKILEQLSDEETKVSLLAANVEQLLSIKHILITCWPLCCSVVYLMINISIFLFHT